MHWLTDLADILRRAPGLTVETVPGWQGRGHGPITSVDSVMLHHTAGPPTGATPSLRTVVEGRPGLDGPLANVYIGRDLVVRTVAAGLAYHAGEVKRLGWTNGRSIGIEVEGTGVDDWPDDLYAAAVRATAALVVGYGLAVDVLTVVGHKEACYPPGRKVDPNWPMPRFRTDVTGAVADLGGRRPGPNPRPVLSRGDRGAAVKALQEALKAAGFAVGPVDGIWGDRTDAAVAGFQVAARLVPDRVVGPRTWAALDARSTVPTVELSRPVGRPDRGQAVTAVQRALVRVGVPLPRYGVDGIAGPEFEAAVKKVQRRRDLEDDGVVGRDTTPWIGGVWTGPRP